MLKQHLGPVIEFDSYVLTSLEGQGPKPVADQIGGELFENDNATLWSQELLGKLTQTRQATVSAEHETSRDFWVGRSNVSPPIDSMFRYSVIPGYWGLSVCAAQRTF